MKNVFVNIALVVGFIGSIASIVSILPDFYSTGYDIWFQHIYYAFLASFIYIIIVLYLNKKTITSQFKKIEILSNKFNDINDKHNTFIKNRKKLMIILID